MNEVIKIEYPEQSICQITMEDKNSRNTFSVQFMEGIKRAYQEIKNNKKIKVVVTTGYENFFCCGGTQAMLLELTQGKKTFADLEFFMLPFDCEILTIAAAQGHAFGGGLSFTCLHDFLVLATESYYSANFMNYGFTPGMGATFTIPRRFGKELGKEMLFSARDYSGKELHQRNSELTIVPREQVLSTALKLAHELNEKTMDSIKLLKRHFYEQIKKELAMAIHDELMMHAKSITSDEAKTRIDALFQKMESKSYE